MAFAGVPAPLLVIYQAQEGFGTVAATVVFAAFPVGVITSVFLAGHLSDRFGRLRLIAPAVLLNVLAGIVFLTSTDLGMLLLARVLSGLGVGMLTATATAHMTELHAADRAAAGRPGGRRAEVVATAANIGGIGVGMLVSGVLADIVYAPLYTPHLVLVFAMVVGLLLVTLVPETSGGTDGPWRYRLQRVAVPAASRPAYAGALVAGFVGFAMFGVFSGLAGTFLAGQLGITAHSVAGLVAFAAFGTSAATQVLTSRWSTATQQRVGAALLAVGLLLLVVSLPVGAFSVFVAGGMVTGAGTGALFKASVGTVVSIAADESRAEALAGLFLAAYVGMSVPIVLLGLLMQVIPVPVAVLVFGSFMLLLIAGSAVLLRTGRRRAHAGRGQGSENAAP